jgi:hypothetical protein
VFFFEKKNQKLGTSINAVLFWLPVLWRRWGEEFGLLAWA